MSSRLVFAPDVSVQFRGGRIVVQGLAKTLPAFQTDQPALVGWLLQFAAPVDAQSALQRLPDEAREQARRAIAYLQESGALVVANDAAVTHTPEMAHTQSRKQLASLSQGVYELACDVLGFGPHAEQALGQRDGVDLSTRLQAVLAAVTGLRAELATLRSPYLLAQLQALGVDAKSRELQLHIGCGPCLLPGWVNVDIHPAPLATNVLWGLPFADGSVRRIFVSHLLEHLFYPNDVVPFLSEIARVLAPGGRVRIVVPDIEQCIVAYQKRDALFFAERRQHWGVGDGNPTRLENFLAYAGAGPDPAYVFEAHKFGYDFETLERALQRAGLVDIERSQFMQSRDESLRVDGHSEVASANYGGQHYSLFVEAGKPGATAIP